MKILILLVGFIIAEPEIQGFFSFKSNYHDENISAIYSGGRFGYYYVDLILYKNNAYSYSEWGHTGFALADSGKYRYKKDGIILTSLKKISPKFPFGKVKPYRVFRHTFARINGDTLYLQSKSQHADYLLKTED
jgi:hypothetical protein